MKGNGCTSCLVFPMCPQGTIVVSLDFHQAVTEASCFLAYTAQQVCHSAQGATILVSYMWGQALAAVSSM